uniref:Uncharacterized protein n=1 Tax=Timema cristinae TaxID=61476 RepID=A0A7R9DBU1_TIMCR|nr:unnamed protein product [Timema cristinae]
MQCRDLTRQINLISSCREELRKESVKPLMKKSQNDLLTQRIQDFFENAEGCSKEFKNCQRTEDADKDVKEYDRPNNNVEYFKEEFDRYGNVFHNDTLGERSSLWTRLFSLIPNLELLHPVNRCIVCFNAITTLYEIPKSSEPKELHELDPKEVTNMTEDEIFMNLYHSDLLGGEISPSETIYHNLPSRIIYQIHDLCSVEHIFDFIDLNCGIDVEKEKDLPKTDKSHFWKPNTSVENIRKTSSNHNNPYYSYNEDDIAESHHGMMLKAKMKTSREHFDGLIPAVLPGPRIFYQLYELPEIDENFDKYVIETTSEEQLKEMIYFDTLSETTQDCEVLEFVDIHDEPEVLHKKLTSAYVFDSSEEVLTSQLLREHSPNCLSFETASLGAEVINHSISLGNALENTEDASDGALNISQYPDWVRGLILDNGKNIPRSFNTSSTLDAIYTTDLANSTSEYFFDILRTSNSEILIKPESYQCNRHENQLGPYNISPERNQVESIYCRPNDRIYKSPVMNDVFYVNDIPKGINSRSLSQQEDIISGFDSTRACLINNNKLSDESDHIINIQDQSSHTESKSDHMSDINPVYKVSGIEKDPGNIYSGCPLFKMTRAHHAINSGYPNTHITGDQAIDVTVAPQALCLGGSPAPFRGP